MSKMKKSVEANIDRDADAIGEEETLIRLLCSPLYYDAVLGIVNIDAFDLRMLGSLRNIPEQFVSLGRKKFLDSEKKLSDYISLGKRIRWPVGEENNIFSAYGEFNCGKARKVSEMIEINPLKGDSAVHTGLFYLKSDGGYYEGSLPKTNPDVLEMLADLADMVSVTVL